MKKILAVLVALTFFGALAAWLHGADEEPTRNEWSKSDGFVVHEWGVVAMKPDGSPAYEADYPDFVKTTQNGELGKMVKDLKPVIYFYSDKRRVLDCTLTLPNPSPTAHWPPATETSLGAAANERRLLESLKKIESTYRIAWKNLALAPVGEITPDEQSYRAVDKSHWWHCARQPKSSWLAVDKTFEKFLFYEQEESHAPSLTFKTNNGAITLAAPKKYPLERVFFVRVKNGGVSIVYHDSLTVEGVVEENFKRAKSVSADGACSLLAEKLTAAGLYADEAGGMAKIWKKEFFETDGLRVLYRIDPAEYERQYPLTFTEKPKRVERVLLMVITE